MPTVRLGRRLKTKYDIKFPGDNSEEATPVPIPNTAVKLFSADGTTGYAVGE